MIYNNQIFYKHFRDTIYAKSIHSAKNYSHVTEQLNNCVVYRSWLAWWSIHKAST